MVGGHPAEEAGPHVATREHTDGARANGCPDVAQGDAREEGDKAREEAETGKAALPPRSAKKRASKVSEVDQVEHILARGQWEGLGAVRKGGEIRIEVRPRHPKIGNGCY